MGMVFEMTVGMVQMMGVFTIRDRNAIYKLERSARFVESNGSESRNDSVNVMAGIILLRNVCHQGRETGKTDRLFNAPVCCRCGLFRDDWDERRSRASVEGMGALHYKVKRTGFVINKTFHVKCQNRQCPPLDGGEISPHLDDNKLARHSLFQMTSSCLNSLLLPSPLQFQAVQILLILHPPQHLQQKKTNKHVQRH